LLLQRTSVSGARTFIRETIVLVYGVSRAAGLALTADALTVSKIALAGAHHTAPGEALALLDGLRGSSIVTVDLEHWRQKLLEAPWVADVAMRRVFPRTVSVEITEREPLGIGRIGNSLYLIDREGTIIDEFGPKYAASTCRSSTDWRPPPGRMTTRRTRRGRFLPAACSRTCSAGRTWPDSSRRWTCRT
jgi:cell division septal protein FtsQ